MNTRQGSFTTKTKEYLVVIKKRNIEAQTPAAYAFIRKMLLEYSGASQYEPLAFVTRIVTGHAHIHHAKHINDLIFVKEYAEFNENNINDFFKKIIEKIDIIHKNGMLFAIMQTSAQITNFDISACLSPFDEPTRNATGREEMKKISLLTSS